MAYHTAEYRRETEDRDNKQGGWRSWFGLDNKDREEDRGYNYTNTTTYRNTNPTYGYSSAPHPERSGFSGPISSGPRGGYGYTTSDEVARPSWNSPSWNTDRDYNTRAGYGQDRDVYYKQETRTYGDRDTTPYSPRPYTTSRDYPTTRDYTTTRDYPTTRDYTTTRDYPISRDYTNTRDYPTTRDYTTTRDYPISRDYTNTRDYPTTRDYTTTRDYPISRDYTNTRDYPTSRTYPVTGDREWNTVSYRTSGDRDWNTTPSRYGYSATRDTEYPTRSYGFESRPYTTGYTTVGDRDFNRTSYPTYRC